MALANLVFEGVLVLETETIQIPLFFDPYPNLITGPVFGRAGHRRDKQFSLSRMSWVHKDQLSVLEGFKVIAR